MPPFTKKYECVIRVEPRTRSAISAMQAHQLRTQPTLNADPKRREMNLILVGTGDFQADLQPYFDNYKKSHAKAQEFAEIICTASSEYFDTISPGWKQGKNLKQIQKWVDKNVSYMQKKYPGMVASAVLHMDELAPHIHFIVVPLHTYTKNFRRGSKTETKIYYNELFGDRPEVITEARRKRDPELTKLGRLQTDYAAAMAEFGLVRGTKNSRASHTRVEEFYGNIQKPVTDIPAKPAPIPEKTVADKAAEAIGTTTENLKNIAKAQKAHADYDKQMRDTIAVLSDHSRHRDMLASELSGYKATEIAHQQREQVIMEENSDLRKQLNFSKEQVAYLRGFNIELVADRLAFTGSLTKPDGKPTYKNAIDMVKDVAGFDYTQAVNWLAREFGEQMAHQSVVAHTVTQVTEQAANVVAKVLATGEPKPLTKAQFAVTKELEKQLDALDADRYRITLKSNEDGTGFNHGKGKLPGGEEKFYTKDEVLKLVPELHYKNVRKNFDVYLTPFKEKTQYVLLDDVKAEVLPEVLQQHRPATIVESSPSNFQCVLPIPEDGCDKNSINNFFRDLNARHGDEKISGLIHPIRAVGFTNRKAKHTQLDGSQPFVKLTQAVAQVCQNALQICREIYEHFKNVPDVEVKKRDIAIYGALKNLPSVEVPKNVAEMASKHYNWCASRFPNTDWSKADFMFIAKARSHAVSDDVIKSAMIAHSPQLNARHKDFDAYIARSLEAQTRSPSRSR